MLEPITDIGRRVQLRDAAFWKARADRLESENQRCMKRIELGGGKLCQSGWINLDPVDGEGSWKRQAQDVPWPTGDETVDEIYASHVMEHIPAGAPRIAVMNEAHRVLRPLAKFTIRVPLLVDWRAVADPTHVSYWVPESFGYFDGSIHYDADYGILPWETIGFWIKDQWEGHWIGIKKNRS